jgi:hypothetical protein
VTSTRCWWSPGKQCRRSSVRPAVTQRGETRDFGLKTPRLTLKFRSDKNISKWHPEAVASPNPGRKMSPLCSTSSGSETLLRIRSLAGSIIDTLESSFQKGQYEATFLPVEPHQVRVSGQPQNGEDARAHHPAYVASRRGRSDRMKVVRCSRAKSGKKFGQKFFERVFSGPSSCHHGVKIDR